MNNYKGIDYSPIGSNVNRDSQTGIRYGIISTHDVNCDALEDVYQSGTDLDFEAFIESVKQNLRSALKDVFSERGGVEGESPLDIAVESAFDAISDDIGDHYQGTGDCTRYAYSKDGLEITLDSTGDLWVIKSPFFTHATFCSPCAPGACSLNSPVEPNLANRCYCLPADWFDDGECPYSIYSVETGKAI